MLTDHEEGRLSFLGATKALGHPVEGEIAVVDVGGGSSEVSLGTIAEGVREVHSFPIGSGVLAEELIESDPPGPVEIRKLRERIEDFFEGVELDHPDQAVAVGGSATSLRRLVGAVLEYETLERGVRVLTSDPAADVAKRFELDPRRVEVLAVRRPPARAVQRSCSASRCRSARAACARASSSRCSATAARDVAALRRSTARLQSATARLRVDCASRASAEEIW